MQCQRLNASISLETKYSPIYQPIKQRSFRDCHIINYYKIYVTEIVCVSYYKIRQIEIRFKKNSFNIKFKQPSSNRLCLNNLNAI